MSIEDSPMSENDASAAIPVITRLELPAPYTWTGKRSVGQALDAVGLALETFGLAILRGFPAQPRALLDFARLFGTPEPRHFLAEPPSLEDTMSWVTRVYYRTDLPDGQERPYTQGAARLELHTARAAAAEQPRLFMMLMADPGQPDDRPDHGQSRFARLDDAIRALEASHGAERCAQILSLLEDRAISTHEPYPDVPRLDPILSRLPDGRRMMRYWEGIADHAAADAAQDPEGGDAMLRALLDFDEALNATAVETELERGDLVLLDNHRVAHGRRAFAAYVTLPDGTLTPSTRLIYNLHTFSDLKVAAA
jgi:alpha-ketoglutarate-dependent taurine dioxygenase